MNARNRLHHHHHHHRHHHRTSSTSKPASEDEFAEDELSVGEPSEARMLTSSTGPAWGTCPAGGRLPRERRGRSPRSLDRRRRDKNHDVGEFHEGMLLDTLLQQLYPSVAGTEAIKSVTIRQKHDCVCVYKNGTIDTNYKIRLPFFANLIAKLQKGL